MIKRTARYVVLGGIFLIPFIPFLVTESMFFPFITGKNFVFRIIVDIILAAWALLAILEPAYRPKRSPIAWGMIAFLVIIGLADVFGVHPMRSFWSNFERMEGFIALLHLGAYFLVAGSTLTSEKLWKRFFAVSVGASVAVSLYAFSQLAGFAAIHQGDVRVDATLGNASYLAVYLLIHIFLALLLAYSNRQNRTLTGAYLLAVALQSIALFYTGTRGAILGVIGGVLLAGLIILVKGRRHPRLRRFSAIALACVIVITGTFFLARQSTLVKGSTTLSRIANISLQDTTVQSRFLLWTKIGWEGFKERPLLGWGQDNFIVVFGEHYDPEMYKQEPWFDRAHNVFMDWLIAGGILGLLAYLFLFGAGIYVLFKTTLPLPEKALISGLLAAYFFHNIFVFDNLISYIYFVSILAYIHARHVNVKAVQPARAASSDSVEGLPVIAGGAVVCAALLVYFLNVPYIARSQTMIEALRLDRSQQYEGVLAEYEKALAYGGTGVEEAKEQLSQMAVRVWRTDAPPDVKKKFVLAARNELEESVSRDAGNTRPFFFLGYLLARTTSPEEGIAVFREALKINPTRQNFLYEIARTYLAMGNLADATVAFREAFEKAPLNDQALAYYAGALIFEGKITEGEQLLLDRFGTTTVDNELVFDGYAKQGKLPNLAAILIRRLAEMAPADDAKTRASVGILYLQMNDRISAVEHLQRAVLLDEAFAPQGLQMIEAIKAGKALRFE